MIMKSNLGKMLGRMAPMARNNMPQGGLSMAAPPTGYRMPQNPVMASPGGGGGFDERTGTYIKAPNPIFNALRNVNLPVGGGTPNAAPGIFGGILDNAAEQFRNAQAMPSNWVSAPRTLTPEEQIAITSMPAARPAQPMPDIAVAPRPTEIPQGVGQISGVGNPIPKFDPNRALQDYNMTLKRLYEGGAKMDLNAAREQQGILRNLQTNLSATPEQHDAAYRTALADLRSRYPDAFAG